MRIYYPSPGCRQGTILAPVAAWRRLPSSGGTWPLDILFVRRPVGRRERLAHERTGERYVRTNKRPRRRRRGTARRITAIMAIRTDHGGHGRSRPVTAVTAGHGVHSRPRPNVTDGGHGGRRERRTRERYCRTTHTGDRTSKQTDRTADSVGDTAPVTAVTASQGRTFRRGVTTPTSR